MRGQDHLQRQGVGMTSQRTRERLIERLYEEGLSNPHVLEVIRRILARVTHVDGRELPSSPLDARLSRLLGVPWR